MTKKEYQAMVEQESRREYLAQDRLSNLLPVYNRIQRRKDQTTDLTLREYRQIIGRTYPCHTIKHNGSIYVSWENAIDNVVTEYGFETPEEIYNALSKLANI